MDTRVYIAAFTSFISRPRRGRGYRSLLTFSQVVRGIRWKMRAERLLCLPEQQLTEFLKSIFTKKATQEEGALPGETVAVYRNWA